MVLRNACFLTPDAERIISMEKIVTDHLGNAFPTIKDMCDYWKIPKNTYVARIHTHHWSLEKALTTPVKERTCRDHLGQEFPNRTEMCKHWGISTGAYIGRMERNWTLEQILTTPSQPSKKECTDHLGNKFTSKASMCEHWNIHVQTYTKRIEKQKWSQEQALTTPLEIQEIIKDPYGNTFDSISSMCDIYEMNKTTHRARFHAEKAMIEILGIIPVLSHTIQNYKFNEHLTIIEAINHTHKSGSYTPKYFACTFDGQEVMLPYQWIIQYCEQHLPPEKNPMRQNA